MPAVEVEPTPAKASPSHWIVGILAGVVLTVTLVGVTIWALTGYGIYELAHTLRGGQTRIGVDQPTVVRQVRALERIETVSYNSDKVLSGERESSIFPDFLAGDRLLLVAHGEVIAGVDLAKLQPSDVEVRGHSVSVHLPAAEIFTASLDNAKTRVYSRDTGLFSSADPNLEGEVRAEAERQIRDAALGDGILKTAKTNAAQSVHRLLAGLGFDSVQVY